MRPAPQLFRKLAPLCAVLFPLSLLAPGSAWGQTNLLVQGGASLATLGGSDVQGADSRAGIRVGASAVLPLAAGMHLQLGAGYAAKGATEQEFGVDIELGLGYLELPLLLRFEPSVGGAISPHLMVGPALALRVSCNAAGTAEGVEISIDCDEDFDDLKSMDFGAMAGAGIDIAASGSLSVSVDVLYGLGLSSISESDDVKNRAFSITAGVAIPIG